MISTIPKFFIFKELLKLNPYAIQFPKQKLVKKYSIITKSTHFYTMNNLNQSKICNHIIHEKNCLYPLNFQDFMCRAHDFHIIESNTRFFRNVNDSSHFIIHQLLVDEKLST